MSEDPTAAPLEVIKDIIAPTPNEARADAGSTPAPEGVTPAAATPAGEKEPQAEAPELETPEDKKQHEERERKKQSAKERIQELAREKNSWRERALRAEQEANEARRRSPEVAPESNIDAALAARDARTAAQNEASAEKQIWETKIDAERERYPDFEKVAYSPEVSYSPVMVEAVREHENGVDIAYHLGKHPDEARRIAQLPPMRAIIELTELGSKLKAQSTPAPKRGTKAPPPIEPLKGASAGATGVDLYSADMDTYFKTRTAQMYPRQK